MTVRSTAPAVKAAVAQLLRTRPGLTGVQVSVGHPGQSIEPDCLIVSVVTGARQEARSIGGRHRDEDYTLDVIVSVARTDEDQETVTARAYELLAEIEDALRDDPNLGGLTTKWVEVAGWSEVEAYSLDFGRTTELTAHLGVSARI